MLIKGGIEVVTDVVCIKCDTYRTKTPPVFLSLVDGYR